MSKMFHKGNLVGGTTGTLDSIDVDDLVDGYKCITKDDTYGFGLYVYDDDSGLAESVPDVIAPDRYLGVAYSGNGRWILQDITIDDLIVGTANIGSTVTNSLVIESSLELDGITIKPPTYSKETTESGGVVVPSPGVTVETLNVGNVTAGDILIATAQAKMVKGGTGGLTSIYLMKDSGTASVEIGGRVFAGQASYTPASLTYVGCVTALVKVLSSGSLVLSNFMTSDGSNGTTSASSISLAAAFILKN